MNCSMKSLVLTAALVFSFGLHAKPIVIGEPSKGTPVTKLQDGKNKVEITTTGIVVDDGDEDKDSRDDKDSATAASISTDDNGNLQIKKGSHSGAAFKFQSGEKLEDIVVPVAFFLFLLTVILGAKYLSSRNEERRLEVLKMMIEKGQPVPENMVNSILTPKGSVESDGTPQTYKRYRNAYGFSIAGFLLMSYAILTHSYDGGAIICGLVFLCLGAGGLAGLYLPKQKSSEKL